MNDSDSFSFQIPGSMLQSNENLLAEDDDDFFGGVDMSTGTAAVPSPLKSQTTTRRMTRSQSRSPQKQHQLVAKTQPPRSAKKGKALTMTASSSFPASMDQGLDDERLMEIEEMSGMEGMDSMDADDAKAPLEPIAAELNKPRSSSRRSRSPSKSKSKSKSVSKAQEQFKASDSLASMSAYLPPPSPDVSTDDRLHPNAFNFNFSPEAKAPAPEPESERAVDKAVQLKPAAMDESHPIREQEKEAPGSENDQRTTTMTTGQPERKIPSSRIERRDKRVTSRSKKTEDPASATANEDVVSQTESSSGAPPVPAPNVVVASRSQSQAPPPLPTETQPPTETRTQIHTDKLPSTSRTYKNPFDALKKRVTSPETEASASSSNAPANVTSSVGERLAQYGQKVMGGSFSLFKSPQDSMPPPSMTGASSLRAEGSIQSQPRIVRKNEVLEESVEKDAVEGVEGQGKPEVRPDPKQKKGVDVIAGDAEGNDMEVDLVEEERVPAAASSVASTTTLVEPPKPAKTTTMKPASTSTESKLSRLPPPPAPPGRVPVTTGSSTSTTAGTKRSAFDTLKAGLDDKPKASGASGVGGNRTNAKKRPSSEAPETGPVSGARAAPGPEGATAAQVPPRKRARRDSVMLGTGTTTAAAASSSRRSLLPPASSTSNGPKAATAPSVPTTVATVTASEPTIMEEPEPEVEATPALVSRHDSPAMDMEVDAEVHSEAVTNVEDVAMDPVAVPVSLTIEPAPVAEAETALVNPTPATAPATGVKRTVQHQTAEPSAAEVTRKMAQKRKREEEAEAQRRRGEAKHEARREQQKVLRRGLAVIAAAAAATVVAAVVADGEEEDDEDEGEDEEEDSLPAPKPADASKVKAEPKGKAKAEEKVSGESRKRARTTSTTAATKSSRSTAASSSKTVAVARAPQDQAKAQVKASRKIATNSRINRGKKEAPSAAAASSSSSSELQNDAHRQTRSHSKAGRNAAVPGSVPPTQATSAASFATSSASSSSSNPRPVSVFSAFFVFSLLHLYITITWLSASASYTHIYDIHLLSTSFGALLDGPTHLSIMISLSAVDCLSVPLPATVPGEFAARTEARRDARQREKQRDAGEGGDGTENANTVTRSTSRTSSRNGGSGNAKEKPPIPDFAAMHAAQAALLARAKASLPPLTKPHGPALTTEARMKERAVFDAHIKEKEAEEERKKEEERRRIEEEEELEIKELRKRAVPKAHEVPEWYRDMPKKTKTATTSGEEASSSTS
ncbi:hypothetical protein D9619_002427 [Psilocybe cf. subviscida]|uniref:TPX2 C-terminal domain-containing protein n=1 Tax=Psilocybe cf. subviscida TaxID=2480587 RepID=A0A8H5AVX3_9AGAR|nr:hypothetical protein D9619_002427 [Psilocybe cf. subviscida]